MTCFPCCAWSSSASRLRYSSVLVTVDVLSFLPVSLFGTLLLRFLTNQLFFTKRFVHLKQRTVATCECLSWWYLTPCCTAFLRSWHRRNLGHQQFVPTCQDPPVFSQVLDHPFTYLSPNVFARTVGSILSRGALGLDGQLPRREVFVHRLANGRPSETIPSSLSVSVNKLSKNSHSPASQACSEFAVC